MFRTTALLAGLLALTALPGAALDVAPPVSDLAGLEKRTTESGFEYCGVQPVFKNPDLQPWDDGFLHVAGYFFIQFQVIADDPDLQVDRLGYSFGKPIPESQRTCDTPEWITGAYFRDYRVDDDPSDGFFIPINTTNVPDGDYAAAIHVYSGGTEIGRGFSTAKVENGCQLWGCADQERAAIHGRDIVQPWPVVLPGDGVRPDGGQGLSIEFAEPVHDVRATVNGLEVALGSKQPRLWDDDAFPARLDEDAPANPLLVERVWGPAFEWPGEVPENAVVQVFATDRNNNTVSKILHTTSSAVGGVISLQTPKLDVKVPTAQRRAGVGETASFPVTFVNIGRDTAHTDLHVTAAEGIEVAWEPNHVVVPTGEEATATLVAKGFEQGTYRIKAWSTYKAGATEQRDDLEFTLTVGESTEIKDVGNETLDTTETPEEENERDTPGPTGLLLVAALAVASLGRRRGG